MPERPRHTWRTVLGGVGVVCWFVTMLAIGASLLGRHLVALPRPMDDDAFRQAMSSLRPPGDEGRWLAVHVLYAQCRCSQRIADHLLTSVRPTDVTERVLLVGEDADLEAKLASRGLRVIRTDETSIGTRYHVTAVPLFVLVSPDGDVRYSGGYTTRKQGPDPRDLEILAEAQAGRSPTSLPLFGCAVSARLRAFLNPLGLP